MARHSDHLGSTSVLSDADGLRVEGSEVVYAPFGEVRIGEQTDLTDFGFTGQRLDESTGGLMYYGARYYLPSLRRFISADTIVPGAGNPQALNRYAYVFNNPVNLIDPTGHRPPTEEEEQWWGMEGHHTGGGGGGGGGNAAQGIGNATGGDYQDHWNAHNEDRSGSGGGDGGGGGGGTNIERPHNDGDGSATYALPEADLVNIQTGNVCPSNTCGRCSIVDSLNILGIPATYGDIPMSWYSNPPAWLLALLAESTAENLGYSVHAEPTANMSAVELVSTLSSQDTVVIVIINGRANDDRDATLWWQDRFGNWRTSSLTGNEYHAMVLVGFDAGATATDPSSGDTISGPGHL